MVIVSKRTENGFCNDVNMQHNVRKLHEEYNNAEIMQNYVGINEEQVMNGLTGNKTLGTYTRNIITFRQCPAVETNGECVIYMST